MMNCLVTTSKFASIEQARAYIQSCTVDMKNFCSASLQDKQEFLQKYTALSPTISGVVSGILIGQGINTLREKGWKSKFGWAQIVAGLGGVVYTAAQTSATINNALSYEPTIDPLCDSSNIPPMDSSSIVEKLLINAGRNIGTSQINCEPGVWDRNASVYNLLCKVYGVYENSESPWSAECAYENRPFPGAVQVIAYSAG